MWLSGLLSDIVESICQAVKDPFEVISSEDLLARINEFNERIERKLEKEESYDWRKENILLGTDVVSLFPSLSAEKTGEALRRQVEKSSIVWEDIDEKWLSLYVRLNKDLCPDFQEIANLCPIRRRGKRGKEAGMGSMECDKRELNIDDPESNWEWPNLPLGKEEIKKLMARALEISVRFFFSHFAYTFCGELYIQMFGGPIGARLTMCLARIVLQEWREEFSKIIERSELEELLSKIYVDDNRSITKIVRPGLRFNVENKSFVYDEKWVREDEQLSDKERTMREILKAMNCVNEDLRFTMEHESDFQNGRLPTLAFEIWSTKEGIRLSYYENPMRNQVLTMKRSSMSENSKKLYPS